MKTIKYKIFCLGVICCLCYLMACSSQKNTDTKDQAITTQPTVKTRPDTQPQQPTNSNLPQGSKNNDNNDRPIPSGNNTSPNMPGVPPGAQPPKSPTPKPNVGEDCFDTTKATNKPCMRNYDPVCGCNGITYANDCLASNAGVLKWIKGECGK